MIVEKQFAIQLKYAMFKAPLPHSLEIHHVYHTIIYWRLHMLLLLYYFVDESGHNIALLIHKLQVDELDRLAD